MLPQILRTHPHTIINNEHLGSITAYADPHVLRISIPGIRDRFTQNRSEISIKLSPQMIQHSRRKRESMNIVVHGRLLRNSCSPSVSITSGLEAKIPPVRGGIVLICQLVWLPATKAILTWGSSLTKLRSRPNSPYSAVQACNSTLTDMNGCSASPFGIQPIEYGLRIRCSARKNLRVRFNRQLLGDLVG